MVVALRELVGTAAHMRDDSQAKALGLLVFAVVLAYKGDETFGQTDEADAEGAVVDDRLDGVGGLELVAAVELVAVAKLEAALVATAELATDELAALTLVALEAATVADEVPLTVDVVAALEPVDTPGILIV